MMREDTEVSDPIHQPVAVRAGRFLVKDFAHAFNEREQI
jgi:hypothetical protein